MMTFRRTYLLEEDYIDGEDMPDGIDYEDAPDYDWSYDRMSSELPEHVWSPYSVKRSDNGPVHR